MSTKDENYFSSIAHSYERRSRAGLWAWQRRREAKAVFDMLGPVAGFSVLDIGCGSGFYTRLLLQHGADSVTAVDVSAEMLATVPTDKVRQIEGDVATFVDDIKAKLVVCAGLLEFTQDPSAVLRNARRHATPGARLVCLVPTSTLTGRLYARYHAAHNLSVHLFTNTELAVIGGQSGWHPQESRLVWPFSLLMSFDSWDQE